MLCAESKTGLSPTERNLFCLRWKKLAKWNTPEITEFLSQMITLKNAATASSLAFVDERLLGLRQKLEELTEGDLLPQETKEILNSVYAN